MYLATLGLRDAAGRAADKPVLYRVLTYAEMARQTLCCRGLQRSAEEARQAAGGAKSSGLRGLSASVSDVVSCALVDGWMTSLTTGLTLPH